MRETQGNQMHLFGDDDETTQEDVIIHDPANIEAEDELIDTNGNEDEDAANKGENDDIEDSDSDDTAKKSDDSDDGDDWSVTIGDDDPDPEDDLDDDPENPNVEAAESPRESSVIRDLRKQLRKAKREVKSQKRAQNAKAEDQLPELGDKPTMESCGFDDEKYEADMVKYLDAKKQHDQAKAKIKDRQDRAQKAHEDRLSRYAARKTEIAETNPEIEDAEEAVIQAFDDTKQAILVTAATDPTVMVLALGQSPKMLEKLNAIADPIEFAATVARMEGNLTVKGTKSKRTAPEKRVRRGSAPTKGVGDTKLERLRVTAAKTGDMTPVIEYKRQLKREAKKKR